MTEVEAHGHECRFVEEQEPEGRLVLGPCLTCGLSAMDAMEQLHGYVRAADRRMHLILSTIYSTEEEAAKFRSIERLARLDWDDEGFSSVV